MATAGKATTDPQDAQEPWRNVRQAVAWVLFATAAAALLYGAWLALLMHFTKSMPGVAINRFFLCALAGAALYAVAVRVEPLPARRKRRGKRWLGVDTPTTRQIWETAPGDFLEGILCAIGMMAMPTVMFITVGLLVAWNDLPDYIVALGVAVGAFALQGVLVKWRGRRMFDPPGRVRKADKDDGGSKAAADALSGEAGAPNARETGASRPGTGI